MIKRRRGAQSRPSRNNVGGYLGHVAPSSIGAYSFGPPGPMDQAQLQKIFGGAPGMEIFERACKPSSNVWAVTYRVGMTSMFLCHAPELQDKVFRTAATIPMKWMGVGVVRKGLHFYIEDFMRRVSGAA